MHKPDIWAMDYSWCEKCGNPSHDPLDCETASIYYTFRYLDKVVVHKPFDRKPKKDTGRI